MDRLFANNIAENLWSQCDSEGRQFQVINEIIDHRTNERALTKENGYVMGRNRSRIAKKTTIGWEMLVEFNDGVQHWIPMKDIKDSNPIDLAEYAVSNGIADEPAFVWWVDDCLHL